MAERLIGSEIIKLAGEIRALAEQGQQVYNLTIGDFDPAIFPIPDTFRDAIVDAYQQGHTNYPAGNGMLPLRKAAANLIRENLGLDYSPEEFLISGGARPLIYTIFDTIVDPGEKVIYPVPSWNNNHYTHLMRGQRVEIETLPEDNFMPTAAQIEPHIADAALLAVCSPLNPTGTVFSEDQLRGICELVLAENQRRKALDLKPLFLMYDQIYWMLTYNETRHLNPVSLYPALRDYTIFVDGMSKGFAATGVRVGWSFGPKYVIDKMNAIASHIGSWAPKAEQMAAATFLNNRPAVDEYLTDIRSKLFDRLHGCFQGFSELKQAGFAVDAIDPQAAIYLTVKFDLLGSLTADGQVLETHAQVHSYLLNEAKMALVPFGAFGAGASPWYRLSVGTLRMEDIPQMFSLLRAALEKLRVPALA